MMPELISEAERFTHREEAARAIQAATGLDEVLIERLVRTFYEAARRDPRPGRDLCPRHRLGRRI